MLPAKSRWHVREIDSPLVRQWSETLQLHPWFVQFCINRGFSSFAQVEQFLSSNEKQLYSPFLLRDMDIAVERIQRAIKLQEKIRIYGDYDADGISSTVMLIQVCQQLGAIYDYYIPHRTREGYGLNRHAILLAKEAGVKLIITVDNGISAYDEVELIHELGMDVIITDHHEPPERLPRALAIINPKRPECTYPFKQLAGVGVAFKLAHALLGYPPLELISYVSLGTIADLMPLLDENRVLVKLGLQQMRVTSNWGIRCLMEVAAIEPKKISAGIVGFSIAPRINASGRLEHADEAVQLLTSRSYEEAKPIALSLDALNRERQELVEAITSEAVELAKQQLLDPARKVLVVAKEGWNVGVVGIVASKLVELFYRPAFVIGIDSQSQTAKGSGRSIPTFDLYQALTKCQQWLMHYGGHHAAAGVTLQSELIDDFTEAFEQWAQESLSEDDLIPVRIADVSSAFYEDSPELVTQFDQLAPFGMGNPSPKLVLKEVKIEKIQLIGKEKQHFKITGSQTLSHKKTTFEAIAFHKSSLLPFITSDAKVDLFVELSIQEWQGTRSAQFIVQELSIPHIQFFDWRQAESIEEKLAGIVDFISELSTQLEKPKPVIVCFDYQMEKKPPDEWLQKKYPILTISSHNEIAMNFSLSPTQSFTFYTDVVFFHLPPSVAVMKSLLKQFTGLQRAYCVFRNQREANELFSKLPNREDFKNFYVWLNQHIPLDSNREILLKRYITETSIPESCVDFMFRVFEELQFIACESQKCTILSQSVKKDLSTSRLWQHVSELLEVEQLLLQSNTRDLSEWMTKHYFHEEHTKEKIK